MNPGNPFTINFDDLSVPAAVLGGSFPILQIPNGYKGFTWGNAYVMRGKDYCPQSGHPIGTTSLPNSMWNGLGNDAVMISNDTSKRFTLYGFVATASFQDNLSVTFISYNVLGQIIGSDTIVVSRNAPVSVDFSAKTQFKGIYSLLIRTSGGTFVLGTCISWDFTINANRREVVIDNMVLSFDA